MVERYGKFSAAISKISHCIQKIEAEEMAKYGLPGSCAQYLAALGSSEQGLSVSQLSEVCMKDKAAVSRAVALLEEKELVKRNTSGANMYRAAIVLTEKGREASRYVAKRASTAVEIAGVDVEVRDRLYNTLNLIATHLTEICKEGLPE